MHKESKTDETSIDFGRRCRCFKRRPCLFVVRRTTTLQYARQGEDINRQVAQDASVTTSVMMTSYVTERDEELRQKSNRFFARIVARLHPTVAARYGHVETPTDELKRRLRVAVDAGDWKTAAKIAAQLDDADSSAA